MLKEARPSIIARFRPLSSHEDSQECASVTEDSVQLSTNSSTHKFSYDQVLVRGSCNRAGQLVQLHAAAVLSCT